MIIIETKKLLKTFDGVHAIDHLSLTIERGTVTSIIGPNGSGKSTLVNVLTGLLKIDGGVVVIDEGLTLSELQTWDVAGYGFTRTFQEVRLFNQLSVLDNMLIVLTERQVAGAFFERHGAYHLGVAERLLKKVNLWDKRDALAVNLSYGQRKLLEIVRALAMDTKLYFFDEPYAGLFPEMVKLVSDIIKELRTAGKTVVLIEHNMQLIRELSDEVIVLDGGRLLARGTPARVLARRDVIEAYLGV